MAGMKVCWISAGVSSFVAGYLAEKVDEYIYIDIENQHPDSMRFIKDCERALGKPIQILRSDYRNVQNVIKQFHFINSPYGAKCTEILKKRVRKEWEHEHRKQKITYVWGFDFNEKHRADRLLESMPDFQHEFPLIDKMLSKEDAEMLRSMFQEIISVDEDENAEVEETSEQESETKDIPVIVVYDYSDVTEMDDIAEWYLGEGIA